MKKGLTGLLVLTSLLALSSCSMFEKDVIVRYATPSLDENNNVVYTIGDREDITNIFQNVITPNADKKFNSQTFLGWYVEDSYTKGEDDENALIKGAGILHYNDISKYVKNGEITMYAVYGEREIVHHDLVIGYYEKSGTSGCTEAVMTSFKNGLYTYLTTLGKEPEKMDIILKGYNGDVATSCGAIQEGVESGDYLPTILIGWKGNMSFAADSGISIATAYSDYPIGAKSDRRIHTLTYDGKPLDDLSKKVIEWLGTDEGKASLQA